MNNGKRTNNVPTKKIPEPNPYQEPIVRVTVELPYSYASFIALSYEGNQLEDKIARTLKEDVLNSLESFQVDDWARFLGNAVLRDYEKRLAESVIVQAK